MISPIESVFAGIGKSLSGAASGAASMSAQGSAARQRLEAARQSFVRCYPKCSKAVRSQFSGELNQRDAYYFQMETAPMMGGPQMRAGALEMFEGISGGMGNRVGEKCRWKFRQWVDAYLISRDGKASGTESAKAFSNYAAKHNTAMATARQQQKEYIICRDTQEIRAVRFLK
tara:strand:- start:35811 stop:36329 length:519 start_codon:yes stop_codon:yes gene_type:complete